MAEARRAGDLIEPSEDGDSQLAAVLEGYLSALETGLAVPLEQLLTEYPAIAERLHDCLGGQRMVEGTAKTLSELGYTPDAVAPERRLGDFRLLREVGRGGMGVVYEAIEIQLGRRVALKVLPFVAALDPRKLKRFQLEAQAVASLNHRNIVSIFSVGRDRGVSYFAMQLIDGRTLADVNRELRQFATRGRTEETIAVSDVTRSLLESLPPHGLREEVGSDVTARESEVTPPQTDRSSSPPSPPPTRGRAFFRTVAGLGRQAAEALAHVHDLGIQHRDIKPANLLVDTSGHLWVTDFGLARLQGDGEQTRTGEMVGTLRYMSPEQALARPGIIDHRTDIYSLGATLYELLTLRPAFGGDDRNDLLMRVVKEAPMPPRRLVPAIPIDLETIVTKAMAKEPRRRYATAQELAEDLTRFIEGRPVLARRPSLVDGVAKWVRRRWPLVVTACSLFILFVACLIVGLSWSNSRLRIANDRLIRVVTEANNLRRLSEETWRTAVRHRNASHGHRNASQIRLAEQALGQGQIERTQDILGVIKPSPNGINPRHFAWHYLWQMATQEIALLRGHEERIHCMTLSPDGRSLASVDITGKTLVWDALSGRLRTTLAGKNSWREFSKPKFSPNSRYLLTVETGLGELPNRPQMQGTDVSSAVVLWEPITGRRLSRTHLNNKAGELFGVNFVSGGEAILIQWKEPDHTITTSIWNLNADHARPQFRFEVRNIAYPCYTPAGRFFSSSQIGQLQVRDVATGTVQRVLPDIFSEGFNVSFSPDGQLIAMSSPKHGAVIQDVESGVVIGQDKTKDFHSYPVFSADGQTIVVGGPPKTESIHIWERSTNQWSVFKPFGLENIGQSEYSLSPDGTRLALSGRGAGGGGGPVTLWDVSTRRLLKTFPGRSGDYGTPMFSPDGRSLYLSCSSEICKWDLEPPDSVLPRSLAGHADEAWAVAFSPDGRVLASGSDDTDEPQRIKLWDTANGRLLKGWEGHLGTVSSLAFSPDGRSLASAAMCNEKNASIWDATSGRLRVMLVGHTDSVRTVAYSPDGTLLATAGSDRGIRIWDPASGHLLSVLSGHTQAVYQVAFSPDGRVLASASNDRTVRLWDVAAGVELKLLEGTNDFMAIAFSPDGSLLAAAEDSGRITLYDPATGTSRGRIHCNDNALLGLAISPDGGLIAAAGASRTIHIWDVATRQELMNLPGHQHQINDLAFSPDGMMLASCSHDGAVKIWDARPRVTNRHGDVDNRFRANDSSGVDFDVPSTYFRKEE